MSQVATLPSLDKILFGTPDPRRTELLGLYLLREEPVKVRLVGEKGPRQFFALGKTFQIGEEGIWVTPRTAIELLYLYGVGGIYRGFDQRTGMTELSLYRIDDEKQRERLRKEIRPLVGYLTTEEFAAEQGEKEGQGDA